MKKNILRTRIVRETDQVKFQRELETVYNSWLHLGEEIQIDIQYSASTYGEYGAQYTALVIAYSR
jgi:hypothetical protein